MIILNIAFWLNVVMGLWFSYNRQFEQSQLVFLIAGVIQTFINEKRLAYMRRRIAHLNNNFLSLALSKRHG